MAREILNRSAITVGSILLKKAWGKKNAWGHLFGYA